MAEVRSLAMPASVPALPELSDRFGATRDSLQTVAAHVLARRRNDVTGRFGLRATPGGFGTPAFGPGDEVVRITGDRLVREWRDDEGYHTASAALTGATLHELGTFASVDLGGELSLGHDTPPLPPADLPLDIHSDAASVLAVWFGLGSVALDLAVAAAGPDASPSTIQLWPEHFDLGVDVAAGSGRVNLGASPGDGFHDTPYLYVGPWTDERPGDPAFWNAPFGAALGYDDLRRTGDPLGAAVAFFRRGLDLLHAG